ncbi:MAG: hypothetical protein K2X87_31100, partial [Gemmataceae bacterium]|nr:hypothetical protein [Gemmataceae bacterium]
MRRVLIAQVAWAALAVSLGLAARPAAAGLIVNRLDPSAGWDATDLPAVVLPPGVADLPADPAPIPAPDLPVEAAPVRAGPAGGRAHGGT